MNNKGFTLIELLAVIVILAIIALIATPIILDLINDARAQAKKRSAELVYTGVEYAYTSALYGTTDGAYVGEPNVEQIKNKFTVENAEIKEFNNDAGTIKIETSDKAYCLVTKSSTEITVACGSATDYTGTDLLNKTISTAV